MTFPNTFTVTRIRSHLHRQLLVIAIALALQLLLLWYSFTPAAGSVFANLGTTSPTGNYFEVDRGMYITGRIEPDWQRALATGTDAGLSLQQWNRLGILYVDFPESFVAFGLGMSWTIVPTLLTFAAPLGGLWKLRRRAARVTKGECATCGYNLHEAHDRCVKCGTTLNDEANCALQRVRDSRFVSTMPPPNAC